MFTTLEKLIKERQRLEAEDPKLLYLTTDNFCDVHGKGLIHYAVKEGRLNELKALIETKKVDINLKDGNKQTALQIALNLGRLDFAHYLYEQGADCISITCTQLNQTCREWLHQKLQTKLKNAVEQTDSTFLFWSAANNKGKLKNHFKHFFALTQRAAELGNVEFLKGLVEKKPLFISLKKGQQLLALAAANDQKEIIDFLVTKGIEINPKPYRFCSPLQAAIENKQFSTMRYLIEKGADVEWLNNQKENALLVAIRSKSPEAVNLLLENKNNFAQKDIESNTIWHLAIKAGKVSVLQKLAEFKEAHSLLLEKNIYGQSAIDLAISSNDPEMVACLRSITGEFPIDNQISNLQDSDQSGVIDKLCYYLVTQYRDPTVLDQEGVCGGLSFLYSYYHAKGVSNYFFHTLAMISAWDGESESLNTDFSAHLPQAHYYKNLGQLIEQWLNDIIWFQQGNKSKITSSLNIEQKNRSLQYQFAGNEEAYHPHVIAERSYTVTAVQLKEFIQYFLKMPTTTYCELANGKHKICLAKNNQNQIEVYDPNGQYVMAPIGDAALLAERIINMQYILIDNYNEGKLEATFQFFAFAKDYDKVKNASLFNKKDYPISTEAAKQFQTQSENGFTPLHVAVLFNDFPALERLINDNYCDINAVDQHGYTAFDQALKYNSKQIIDLLLKQPEISVMRSDKICSTAMKQLLGKPSGIAFEKLDALIAAIKQDNLALARLIINALNRDGISLDTLGREDSGKRLSPLFAAIRLKKLPMFKLLLENGASLGELIKTATVGSSYSALYEMVKIEQDFDLLSKAIPDFNYNLIDKAGKSLLDYAIEAGNTFLVAKLIEKGADFNLPAQSHRPLYTLIEIVKNPPKNLDQAKITLVCDAIVSQPGFTLDNEKHADVLQRLLIEAFNSNYTKLFALLVEKAEPAILDRVMPRPWSKTGKTLLHVVLDCEYDKETEFCLVSLLKKEVRIDIPDKKAETVLEKVYRLNQPEITSIFKRFCSSFITRKGESRKI